MHWRDKVAVVKGHEIFHRTIFQKTELALVHIEIRPIAADVAAAVVIAKVVTTPDGTLRSGTQDRLSFILTRRNGRWQITHGHNTVIDPTAQPFDPVNSGWTGEGVA
jgi:uncharacterized protein (TIGR02246 family)